MKLRSRETLRTVVADGLTEDEAAHDARRRDEDGFTDHRFHVDLDNGDGSHRVELIEERPGLLRLVLGAFPWWSG